MSVNSGGHERSLGDAIQILATNLRVVGGLLAMPLVLSYLPCEFLAFILTASVAQGAAWMTLRCLAARERVRPGGAVLLLVSAVLLLTLAAALEAWVKPAIGALGRPGHR